MNTATIGILANHFFQRNIKKNSLLFSALLRGDSTHEKSIKGQVPDIFSVVQMNKEVN